MGHDCGCQPRRVHKTSCSWYDDNNIYLTDTQADLSISGKVAQQRFTKSTWKPRTTYLMNVGVVP